MAHESVKSLLSFEQFILDSHHCLCAPDVDILFDSSCVFMLVFLSVCGFTLAQTKQLVWLVWKMLTGPQKSHHFMSRRWFTFEGKVRIEVSFWLQSRSRRDVKKKWDSYGSQYVPATHTETQMHTHTNKPLLRVFRDLRTLSPSIFAEQEQARLKMYRTILHKSSCHVFSL